MLPAPGPVKERKALRAMVRCGRVVLRYVSPADARRDMENSIDRLITTLNSLHVGDLDRITARLEEASRELSAIEQPDLVEKVEEARQAIRRGDVPLFRKRLQMVVSRLGHRR